MAGLGTQVRGGLALLSLQLAYLLWKETGETSQFDETLSQRPRKFSIFGRWNKTTRTLLIVLSEIRTARNTLVNGGFGPDFAVTGMTWSAFRQVMTAVSIVT